MNSREEKRGERGKRGKSEELEIKFEEGEISSRGRGRILIIMGLYDWVNG